MKTKNLLWTALSMAVALVMTACGSDSDVKETPVAPQPSVTTIPYTVTVGSAMTRATVDSDNRTLRFATGDKLYITGTNIKGVLYITSGVGQTEGAIFSGDLNYTGSGLPADNLELTATLVSAQQAVGTQVAVSSAGAVTVNYPTTAYCATIGDAVQQYSRLTGTCAYSAKAFSLTQQTAFLNFVITFDDGTTTGTALSAVVSNGGSAICTANVTTTTEDAKVVAKFVLPIAAGTTLSSATVTMGDEEALAISNATLAGKVYNVKKTQQVYVPSDAINGRFSVSSTKRVFFSKGNLQYQASTNTWRFAENQWDYVGNATAGNVYVSGVKSNNASISSTYTGWIDLFGWGTSGQNHGATAYQPWSTSSDNSHYYAYGNQNKNLSDAPGTADWGKSFGSGWRTLTKEEWEYVFNTRASGSTVNGISNARYAQATINTDANGVDGVILFPDGVTIDNSEATSWGTINGNSEWGTKCTAAQWTALTDKGCVFLPVTGTRDGTVINAVGEHGSYWSSTYYNSNHAYHVFFYSSGLVAQNYNRCRGFAVRLVR